VISFIVRVKILVKNLIETSRRIYEDCKDKVGIIWLVRKENLQFQSVIFVVSANQSVPKYFLQK